MRMNKKTFSNLISKEKTDFEASVSKYRRLNQLARGIEVDNSRSSSTGSNRVACYNDDVASTSRAAGFHNTDLVGTNEDSFSGYDSNSDSNGYLFDAIHKRLNEVCAKLDSVETRQLEVIDRINEMQGALSEKMPERAEVQAQSKLLRECKILTARVSHSVSRITGDLKSEKATELASMLPMSSVEQVQAVDAKLKSTAYANAMLELLGRRKGTKGTVDGVLRGLFKDDTAAEFNLEGRAGKFPLSGLVVVELLFDIFPEKPKEEVRSSIKKYISLSHNRNYQKKFVNKKNLNRVVINNT